MRHIRIPGAVVIIAACALVIYRGWDVAHFSMIEASVGRHADQHDVLKSFFEVGGIGSLARQAALPQETESVSKDGALKRRDDLADLLSVRPLSSAHWLSFSRMQLQEEPSAMVVTALTLSDMTGPYEENVLVERAIFSMSMWESLPEHLRKRTIEELVTAFPLGVDRDRIRATLFAKAEKVRHEIRTALLQSGRFAQKDLAGIGL